MGIHIPLSQAAILIRMEETPPTCLLLKMEPNSTPKEMNSSEIGRETATAANVQPVTGRPSAAARAKHRMLSAAARGSSGREYPAIYSALLIGEANIRMRKELSLSDEMSIPRKSEINDMPKTTIPGARFSRRN